MTHERWSNYLTPNGQLRTDDGAVFSVNDHAYFVCEPPGEPYYLARIMQFLHVNGDLAAPVESVRVNWYYRPKDIQRKVQDTRVVFASMHSDTCPLTSLRGNCRVQHLSEISNLDEYRVQKDSFWFDKLFDRYIHRYYEVIPTNKVINVPHHVKKVLDDRWKFVLVEIGRGKELTSAVKTCKKCGAYAANHDSVDCAVCKSTYHMACVRPVLTKKPARGFAWACAACSRAQEKKLEARQTPIIGEIGEIAAEGDDEIPEDEEDEAIARREGTPTSSVALEDRDHPPATAEQIAQAVLWPYRYLGVHSKPEDALDYDDRIYPRASSRLGPRHQANVTAWHGRPVELVKPADIRKKYVKPPSHRRDAPKPCKETLALLEADRENKLRRPKWVMDEPPGYTARGEDFPVDIKGKKEKQCTAHVIFKMPDESKFTCRGSDDEAPVSSTAAGERLVEDFMERVRPLAAQYGLAEWSTNFLTKAVEQLYEKNYDSEAALAAMMSLNIRNDLKEPDLNQEEIKRFEEGVMKYGSELHSVSRHVGGGVKHSRIVRFYYMWKKTNRGREIWGNYEGRRSKKESRKLDEVKHKQGNATKLVDDVADDHDDSAFDTAKADSKKRGFVCKFCSTKTSRQWRRAPGTAPGTLVAADSSSKSSKERGSWLTLALCGRCAYLWRRYAIQFESIEEVSKKIAAAGGRASKRRIDEELMRAIVEAQQESGDTISSSTAAVAASAGVEVPSTIVRVPGPARKKVKMNKDGSSFTPEAVPEKKKPPPEKSAEPVALKPEAPRVKVLPCAVCGLIDLPGDDYLSCRDCRLAVHKSCYGVHRERNPKKWYCDMCSNDRNTMVSTTYECVLCPIQQTPHELMEPPKVSHKKKTDREREKERKEKEMVEEAIRLYRQQQEAAGRPPNPREPLKRTAWNNWVHVSCALWTPEIKFGNSQRLEPAEGVGFIPVDRYKPTCKFCKSSGEYPVVACHSSTCNAQFHVGCAHLAGNIFCFDITPVKGSRKDMVATIKLGDESGFATAAIWCPQHAIQPSQHSMFEATDEGLTALQVFAQNFKQVDQSMTGTVRRAAQFASQHSSGPPHPTTPLTARRASTVNGIKADQIKDSERASLRNNRDSPEDAEAKSAVEMTAAGSGSVAGNPHRPGRGESKKCSDCSASFSPKWWPIHRRGKTLAAAVSVNGSRRSIHGLEVNHHQNTDAVEPPLAEQSTSHVGSQISPAYSNGIVKSEPASSELNGMMEVDVPEQALFQCHKCHLAHPSSLPPSSATPEVNHLRKTSPLPSPPSGNQQLLNRQLPNYSPSTTGHPDPRPPPENPWSRSVNAPPRAWPPVPEPASISLQNAPSPAAAASLPPPRPPPTSPSQQHSLGQANSSHHLSPSYLHRPPPPLLNGYGHPNSSPTAAASVAASPSFNGASAAVAAPPAPAPPHRHPLHHSHSSRPSHPPTQFSPPAYPRPTNAHLYSASPSPPSSHPDPRPLSPQPMGAPPMPYAGHHASVPERPPSQSNQQGHGFCRSHSQSKSQPQSQPPSQPPSQTHPQTHPQAHPQSHSQTLSRSRGHSFDGYAYVHPPSPFPPPPTTATATATTTTTGGPYFSSSDNNMADRDHRLRLHQDGQREWERERERERYKERERNRPPPGAASASPSLKNLLS